MKRKTKKNLIEYGIIFAIFGGLYITGLHTEVLGFLQRGVLATGLMDPDLDKNADLAVNDTNSKAYFSMSLINSKGEKVAMEDLRGKVIFMNLWATWCPPCVAEMPGINKLYQDVDKDKVAFIMLSLDQDFQKAIDYNEKKGYDFEVYRVNGAIPEMYNSQSIPTTYVIDPNGNLVLTTYGNGRLQHQGLQGFP
ncbi:TlpA disulfide reductase family protein [Salegentibacter sp. F188]|uniref:TlpA disulfide reductase family protein n=1 Tax=Autumnicola patrickiae TaxID=3075591 RepID=A0ABU3E5L1_9FLAO|nr:TlpA disulfide reductase family protein [Salegentibacter sp. F188]MDT0690929.1 TlpA disulfide reductase family protein [Salegentibacter sp. F188]